MKAQATLSFTDQQLRALLSTLSPGDCKYAILFLQERIEYYKTEKVLRVPPRSLGPKFLDTSIKEFELTNRTKNNLLSNKIFTVRDLTEIGVDKLSTFRGFGISTIREIRQVVFEQEMDLS